MISQNSTPIASVTKPIIDEHKIRSTHLDLFSQNPSLYANYCCFLIQPPKNAAQLVIRREECDNYTE